MTTNIQESSTPFNPLPPIIPQSHWKSFFSKETSRFYGFEKGDKRNGFGFAFNNNGYYEGNWKNDQFSGVGKLKYLDLNISYLGAFQQSKFNGFGTLKCQNFQYQGEFNQGQMEGFGFVQTTDGIDIRGLFIADRMHGYCEIEQPQISSSIKGMFKSGKKDGYSIEKNKSFLYSGNFKNNQREGFGSLKKASYTYLGSFKNGEKEGFGKLSSKNSEYTGEFKKNQRHGFAEEIQRSPKLLYTGEFYEGKKTGFGRILSDEYLYIGYLKEGEKHNLGLLKKKDGQVYKGEFLKDKFHGFGEFKSPSNSSILQAEWKKGVLHGRVLVLNIDKSEIKAFRVYNNGEISQNLQINTSEAKEFEREFKSVVQDDYALKAKRLIDSYSERIRDNLIKLNETAISIGDTIEGKGSFLFSITKKNNEKMDAIIAAWRSQSKEFNISLLESSNSKINTKQYRLLFNKGSFPSFTPLPPSPASPLSPIPDVVRSVSRVKDPGVSLTFSALPKLPGSYLSSLLRSVSPRPSNGKVPRSSDRGRLLRESNKKDNNTLKRFLPVCRVGNTTVPHFGEVEPQSTKLNISVPRARDSLHTPSDRERQKHRELARREIQREREQKRTIKKQSTDVETNDEFSRFGGQRGYSISDSITSSVIATNPHDFFQSDFRDLTPITFIEGLNDLGQIRPNMSIHVDKVPSGNLYKVDGNKIELYGRDGKKQQNEIKQWETILSVDSNPTNGTIAVQGSVTHNMKIFDKFGHIKKELPGDINRTNEKLSLHPSFSISSVGDSPVYVWISGDNSISLLDKSSLEVDKKFDSFWRSRDKSNPNKQSETVVPREVVYSPKIGKIFGLSYSPNGKSTYIHTMDTETGDLKIVELQGYVGNSISLTDDGEDLIVIGVKKDPLNKEPSIPSIIALNSSNPLEVRSESLLGNIESLTGLKQAKVPNSNIFLVAGDDEIGGVIYDPKMKEFSKPTFNRSDPKNTFDSPIRQIKSTADGIYILKEDGEVKRLDIAPAPSNSYDLGDSFLSSSFGRDPIVHRMRPQEDSNSVFARHRRKDSQPSRSNTPINRNRFSDDPINEFNRSGENDVISKYKNPGNTQSPHNNINNDRFKAPRGKDTDPRSIVSRNSQDQFNRGSDEPSRSKTPANARKGNVDRDDIFNGDRKRDELPRSGNPTNRYQPLDRRDQTQTSSNNLANEKNSIDDRNGETAKRSISGDGNLQMQNHNRDSPRIDKSPGKNNPSYSNRTPNDNDDGFGRGRNRGEEDKSKSGDLVNEKDPHANNNDWFKKDRRDGVEPRSNTSMNREPSNRTFNPLIEVNKQIDSSPIPKANHNENSKRNGLQTIVPPINNNGEVIVTSLDGTKYKVPLFDGENDKKEIVPKSVVYNKNENVIYSISSKLDGDENWITKHDLNTGKTTEKLLPFIPSGQVLLSENGKSVIIPGDSGDMKTPIIAAINSNNLDLNDVIKLPAVDNLSNFTVKKKPDSDTLLISTGPKILSVDLDSDNLEFGKSTIITSPNKDDILDFIPNHKSIRIIPSDGDSPIEINYESNPFGDPQKAAPEKSGLNEPKNRFWDKSTPSDSNILDPKNGVFEDHLTPKNGLSEEDLGEKIQGRQDPGVNPEDTKFNGKRPGNYPNSKIPPIDTGNKLDHPKDENRGRLDPSNNLKPREDIKNDPRISTNEGNGRAEVPFDNNMKQLDMPIQNYHNKKSKSTPPKSSWYDRYREKKGKDIKPFEEHTEAMIEPTRIPERIDEKYPYPGIKSPNKHPEQDNDVPEFSYPFGDKSTPRDSSRFDRANKPKPESLEDTMPKDNAIPNRGAENGSMFGDEGLEVGPATKGGWLTEDPKKLDNQARFPKKRNGKSNPPRKQPNIDEIGKKKESPKYSDIDEETSKPNKYPLQSGDGMGSTGGTNGKPNKNKNRDFLQKPKQNEDKNASSIPVPFPDRETSQNSGNEGEGGSMRNEDPGSIAHQNSHHSMNPKVGLVGSENGSESNKIRKPEDPISRLNKSNPIEGEEDGNIQDDSQSNIRGKQLKSNSDTEGGVSRKHDGIQSNPSAESPRTNDHIEGGISRKLRDPQPSMRGEQPNIHNPMEDGKVDKRPSDPQSNSIGSHPKSKGITANEEGQIIQNKEQEDPSIQNNGYPNQNPANNDLLSYTKQIPRDSEKGSFNKEPRSIQTPVFDDNQPKNNPLNISTDNNGNNIEQVYSNGEINPGINNSGRFNPDRIPTSKDAEPLDRNDPNVPNHGSDNDKNKNEGQDQRLIKNEDDKNKHESNARREDKPPHDKTPFSPKRDTNQTNESKQAKKGTDKYGVPYSSKEDDDKLKYPGINIEGPKNEENMMRNTSNPGSPLKRNDDLKNKPLPQEDDNGYRSGTDHDNGHNNPLRPTNGGPSLTPGNQMNLPPNTIVDNPGMDGPQSNDNKFMGSRSPLLPKHDVNQSEAEKPTTSFERGYPETYIPHKRREGGAITNPQIIPTSNDREYDSSNETDLNTKLDNETPFKRDRDGVEYPLRNDPRSDDNNYDETLNNENTKRPQQNTLVSNSNDQHQITDHTNKNDLKDASKGGAPHESNTNNESKGFRVNRPKDELNSSYPVNDPKPQEGRDSDLKNEDRFSNNENQNRLITPQGNKIQNDRNQQKTSPDEQIRKDDLPGGEEKRRDNGDDYNNNSRPGNNLKFPSNNRNTRHQEDTGDSDRIPKNGENSDDDHNSSRPGGYLKHPPNENGIRPREDTRDSNRNPRYGDNSNYRGLTIEDQVTPRDSLGKDPRDPLDNSPTNSEISFQDPNKRDPTERRKSTPFAFPNQNLHDESPNIDRDAIRPSREGKDQISKSTIEDGNSTPLFPNSRKKSQFDNPGDTNRAYNPTRRPRPASPIDEPSLKRNPPYPGPDSSPPEPKLKPIEKELTPKERRYRENEVPEPPLKEPQSPKGYAHFPPRDSPFTPPVAYKFDGRGNEKNGSGDEEKVGTEPVHLSQPPNYTPKHDQNGGSHSNWKPGESELLASDKDVSWKGRRGSQLDNGSLTSSKVRLNSIDNSANLTSNPYLPNKRKYTDHTTSKDLEEVDADWNGDRFKKVNTKEFGDGEWNGENRDDKISPDAGLNFQQARRNDPKRQSIAKTDNSKNPTSKSKHGVSDNDSESERSLRSRNPNKSINDEDEEERDKMYEIIPGNKRFDPRRRKGIFEGRKSRYLGEELGGINERPSLRSVDSNDKLIPSDKGVLLLNSSAPSQKSDLSQDLSQDPALPKIASSRDSSSSSEKIFTMPYNAPTLISGAVKNNFVPYTPPQNSRVQPKDVIPEQNKDVSKPAFGGFEMFGEIDFGDSEEEQYCIDYEKINPLILFEDILPRKLRSTTTIQEGSQAVWFNDESKRIVCAVGKIVSEAGHGGKEKNLDFEPMNAVFFPISSKYLFYNIQQRKYALLDEGLEPIGKTVTKEFTTGNL